MDDMDDLRLITEDGLELEVMADAPAEIKAVLVLCHPHPQMGGTMNAPLLTALKDELVARGWAVLRFNFRGIGSSEGVAGTGIEELKDARAALALASNEWPGVPVAIAGWSFGAAVAVKVASGRRDLVACVAIAPAVRPKPGVTEGLPDPNEIELTCPTLFVVGANDDLTLPHDVRDWATSAGVGLLEIPASNHFFWGRYEKLSRACADFLDGAIGGAE